MKQELRWTPCPCAWVKTVARGDTCPAIVLLVRVPKGTGRVHGHRPSRDRPTCVSVAVVESLVRRSSPSVVALDALGTGPCYKWRLDRRVTVPANRRAVCDVCAS